jgi:hypothetical protein
MRLCTLALGEKYVRLSHRLRHSLPLPLEICTSVPLETAFRKTDGQYSYHNKRFAVEQSYHPAGTLYLDADAICVDQDAFIAFFRSLAEFPPGLYSPYTFSSYGFQHPTVPDKKIDRTRLTPILRFLDSVICLTDEDLLTFKMPYEWLMFFRFTSPDQKTSFFRRYHELHAILMNSTHPLNVDCNLIGLAAQHCRLPVTRLKNVRGVRHKK